MTCMEVKDLGETEQRREEQADLGNFQPNRKATQYQQGDLTCNTKGARTTTEGSKPKVDAFFKCGSSAEQ